MYIRLKQQWQPYNPQVAMAFRLGYFLMIKNFIVQLKTNKKKCVFEMSFIVFSLFNPCPG